LTETLLFAADLHGSNLCFLKLLRLASHIKPRIVGVGGDLTGKTLAVFREKRPDVFLTSEKTELTAHQVSLERQQLGDRGIYSVIVPGVEALAPEELYRLHRQAMHNRLRQWLEYARASLQPIGSDFVFIPGNDDPLDIDADSFSADWTINVDERIVHVGEYLLVGLGFSTPTPYKTPRELSESEIQCKLDALFNKISAEDAERTILLSHVPPFGIGLDNAPEIEQAPDGQFILVPGVEKEVGSQSVRDLVTRRQPLLLLSGHCHDSPGFQRIGRTLCVNPGSAYGQGVLRAAKIVFDGRKVLGYQMLEA
jgi:Icc-related predicted phosphoesterase